ncbi:hypothetical protein LV79_003951 [Actinokineospora globicatena]|nr:hypothetical protein [Actinokineospora globicatena]GLW78395.1 hypothetical protein Aglo01_28770 [Actinokineospora globicatena]GLW84941.1 hypothetical protein Aglo02_25810 [Actinokineospora globicatena]
MDTVAGMGDDDRAGDKDRQGTTVAHTADDSSPLRFPPAPEPPPYAAPARSGTSRPLLSVVAIACAAAQIVVGMGTFSANYTEIDRFWLTILAAVIALSLPFNLISIGLLWKSLVDAEPWNGCVTVFFAVFACWHGYASVELVRAGPDVFLSAFREHWASVAYQAGMTAVCLVLFLANLATLRSART